LIKPSALGDVVQAMPVLSALRAKFPNAHIAWVVNKSYADILAGHPHLDEAIIFDRGRSHPLTPGAWRSMRRLRDLLRGRRFDLVIDLQCLFRSGLMAWATRAPRRVGLSDAREGARAFYTDVVQIPRENMSASDRYWLIAEALGLGSASKQFLFGLTRAELEWADGQLRDQCGLRVAVHAGARWATKRWPAEYFAEVIRRMACDFGVSVVLIGGPAETAAAEQIESAVPGMCLNLVGQTTLKQLAALLTRVRLVLTNDSGPMHLASALGTPVAGLFTCTSPERARPYGDGHMLFATSVWCAASYLKKCSRLECMSELTPDRIWPELAGRLATLRTDAAA
jgi:lipopolysaccharide heptosyltransferase I